MEQHPIHRTLNIWSWLTLCVFFIMLSHESNFPILFNRYSVLVSLMLFGLGMGFIISRWLLRSDYLDRILHYGDTLSQRIHASWWLRGGIILLCSLLISVIWVYFLSNYPFQYAMLRAYLVFSLILWVGVLVRNDSFFKHPIVIFLGIGFILLLVSVATAEFYPSIAHTDEAFIFSMARNGIETGHTNPTIYRHVFPDNYRIGNALGIRALGQWLSVAGYSLYTGRLFTVIILFLSSLLLSWGARRLYNPLTGAIIFALAIFAFMQQVYIRTDSYAVFFICLSILIYSYARERHSVIWHVGVGLSIGMVIDSSLPAFPMGITYALIYAWQYGRQIRSGKRLWLPFWGLVIGGGLAIGYYVVTTSTQTLPIPISDHSSLIDLVTLNPPSKMLALLSAVINQYITFHPVLVVLLLLTVIQLMTDQHRARIHLTLMWLLFLGLWVIFIALIYQYFTIHYVAFGLPFILLLASQWLAYDLPDILRQTQRMSFHGAYILLIIWLGIMVAFNLAHLPSTSLEAVVETGHRIAKVIPSDAVIVGAEPYYFGMLDHQGFIGGSIDVLMNALKGIPDDQSWDIVHPNAFIFSGNWPLHPRRSPAVEKYMEKNQFELVGCWATQSYGVIELWSQPGLLIAPAPIAPCERVGIPRLNG